jgi:hypothetical protein
MSIVVLRDALLWCSVINYSVLILWYLLYLFAGGKLYCVAKWLRLSREQFDSLQCGGMVGYKLAIILFNIVPYIALRIVLK